MQALSSLERHVDALQDVLEFRHTTMGPHFEKKTGLGRMGLTGFLLGAVLGLHLAGLVGCWLAPWLGVGDPFNILCALHMWCQYTVIIAVFHFLEFFMTAVYQPVSLSYDSFVVAHSKAYTVAMLVCWAEFWLEWLLLGGRKYSAVVFWTGTAIAIGGQAIRVMGMRTCGQSFSHIIVTERPPNHELVTTGIYQYLRHPAYFGWFYWSVATQLVLCNPLSTVAFAGWAWYFFSTRIPYEEATLRQFYGEKYSDYCRHSHIGIPFIPSSGRGQTRQKDGTFHH